MMSVLFVAASTQTAALVSSGPTLAGMMGATLSVWVNPVSLPAADNSVFGFSNGIAAGSSRSKIGVSSTGQVRGNGRCLDADANQNFYGTIGKVTTGNWQHIVATFDYTNKLIRLYYNGTLDATSGVLVWGAAPTSNTNSLAANIGSQHGDGSEYWNGYVEDARCYNRLLALEEIQTIFACKGYDGIIYGLRHQFLLNESPPGTIASGIGVIKDSGMLQINATPANSPTWRESNLRFINRVNMLIA